MTSCGIFPSGDFRPGSVRKATTKKNSVPIVKNRQKTVKQQKMTIGVLIITYLHRVRRIHKAAQTPLPRETSMCLGSGHSPSHVGRADCICVYMDVHASGTLAPVRCRVLLHSLLATDDACSSSSLSTTVIKYSIFSDPMHSQTFCSPARTP